MNNLKNIYKKCKEVLDEEAMKLLPYLFLKKIQCFSKMTILVRYLDKAFRIRLGEYQNYVKIQTIMVDFLKQVVVKEESEREVNLEKAISLNLYETLISLIQQPPSFAELKQKLEAVQYLV